ncbi:hypothetical protein NX801_29900 [Streptomyces sp. LP05-1]|uniref:Uncharacterized protein n=1 Tax=Streptomyces pyxinae TaxID=2970734 RepID=A0ABT2CQR1_9ACTN|nr:hypothetical protein [Streptomyces sp. LP05-1]MCS0639777.1 hypothetical protein [Streptomyces sp. LP05-1]
MPGNSPGNSENWNTALRYIAGRKAAEENLGFLVHISATVRQTPAPEDVLPAVAKACVPFLATAVSLDAPATPGRPAVQSPPELTRALDGVRKLAEAGSGRRLVISGHESLVKETDPDQLELLRQWEADSAAALPLDYRGVRTGHLVLLRAGGHRRGPIGPGDLALAGEVADRVAAFHAFAGRPAGARGL